MKREKFRLLLLDDAAAFLDDLPEKVRNKVYYNVHRIAQGERDRELFKKLEGTDIWEFRTLYSKTAYRLFAFWDNENEVMVVATHGIIKKTQKTPSKEIAKAEALMKRYFEAKHKGK